MSRNNNFAEEGSTTPNAAMNVLEFSEEVFEYFYACFKDSVNCRTENHSDLVHRAIQHFKCLLKDKLFRGAFNRIVSCVFDYFPFTPNDGAIYEVLKTYLSLKMYEYRCKRNKLIKFLPLSRSPLSYIDYYLEPTDEFLLIIVEYFCSPAMILNFSTMKVWVRYGGRFLIYPLETQFYLNNILSCLTVKLLPLVYTTIQWDGSRTVFSYYETYREQRRLYLVLLFVYVILQSNFPRIFPKWRSSLKSLKLIFKAFTEPFITAQEIDRFLRVAAVGEFDEEVSENLCKKFAVEFPNIKEPFGPRSLKHISRCAVRNVLIRSETLPHGVWFLDIPTELKHYILLLEREDEFHPVNVSAPCSSKRSATQHTPAKRPRTSV